MFHIKYLIRCKMGRSISDIGLFHDITITVYETYLFKIKYWWFLSKRVIPTHSRPSSGKPDDTHIKIYIHIYKDMRVATNLMSTLGLFENSLVFTSDVGEVLQDHKKLFSNKLRQHPTRYISSHIYKHVCIV